MATASAFQGAGPKTVVYVDGFNLYYGCLKNTPYKWLDLSRLCALLLPGHDIARIKYFTAEIHSRPGDPDGPIRQSIYLRALRTTPNLEIVLGHFRVNTPSLPLAAAPRSRPKFVRVVRYEEKGSDVNLAAHLVHDAHRGHFDVAAIISNDSDLAEALRIVRDELGLPIGLLNPHAHPSVVLKQHATFYKPIRKGVLQASQLPPELRDSHGGFSRPRNW